MWLPISSRAGQGAKVEKCSGGGRRIGSRGVMNNVWLLSVRSRSTSSSCASSSTSKQASADPFFRKSNGPSLCLTCWRTVLHTLTFDVNLLLSEKNSLPVKGDAQFPHPLSPGLSVTTAPWLALLEWDGFGGVWLCSPSPGRPVHVPDCLELFQLQPWLQLLREELGHRLPTSTYSGDVEDVPWQLVSTCRVRRANASYALILPMRTLALFCLAFRLLCRG
jgi:hypothetical protein